MGTLNNKLRADTSHIVLRNIVQNGTESGVPGDGGEHESLRKEDGVCC